jgi:preprotein translocase subunit SecD
MKYLYLMTLTIVLTGCTTRVSCNSFALSLVADESKVGNTEAYRKLSVAGRPSEQLWVLRKPAFDGGDIEKAEPTTTETILSGSHVPSVFLNKETLIYYDHAVNLKFKENAKKKLHDFSTQHIGEALAIVLDDVILMAPVIREPLPEGIVTISGSMTKEEATRIVARVNLIKNCK